MVPAISNRPNIDRLGLHNNGSEALDDDCGQNVPRIQHRSIFGSFCTECHMRSDFDDLWGDFLVAS